MARKQYIFTNKKHSEKSIMSMILGLISSLSLAAVIYLSYVQEGEAPAGYGVTGLLVMLYAVTGLILGVYTAKEKDRYKLFSCLGIVFNLIALFGIGIVVYIGAYR